MQRNLDGFWHGEGYERGQYWAYRWNGESFDIQGFPVCGPVEDSERVCYVAKMKQRSFIVRSNRKLKNC